MVTPEAREGEGGMKGVGEGGGGWGGEGKLPSQACNSSACAQSSAKRTTEVQRAGQPRHSYVQLRRTEPV